MGKGLIRDTCLRILNLSKNQFYYKSTGQKPRRRASKTTTYRDPETLEISEVNNEEVVQRIVEIKLDPDHANHYRLIGLGLCLLGFFINHKKVYRLMYGIYNTKEASSLSLSLQCLLLDKTLNISLSCELTPIETFSSSVINYITGLR